MIWAHAEFVACGVNEFAGDTTLFVSLPSPSFHLPFVLSVAPNSRTFSTLWHFIIFYDCLQDKRL